MGHEIDSIVISEEITLITLFGFPDNPLALASIFSAIAEAGVNVDMISQSPPMGELINIHFTFNDSDLGQVLELLGKNKGEYAAKRLEVSSGNVKLNFSGEKMRSASGVAASVFTLLSELGISLKLVTTSEVDISTLTANIDIPATEKALKLSFNL